MLLGSQDVEANYSSPGGEEELALVERIQEMNLYLVMSEELCSAGEDWYDPPEWYRIVELVVARSHGQARWLAWSADDGPGDVRDMPKFAVRLKGVGMDGPARIVSDEYKLPGEGMLWDIGKAPHIGIGDFAQSEELE